MGKPKNPQPEDENIRAETARKAQKEGYIRIRKLPDIMASDQSYTEILPFLREKYIPRFFIGSSDYDLSTHQGRFQYWMNLIRRWGGLESAPTKENSPPINYLNCYRRDKITGKFILLDRDKINPEYLDHYMNLDEFANYLKDIENIYQINLPLPNLLYLSPNKLLQQNVQDDNKVFLCESGIKWTDVEITLISNDAVMIKTPIGSGRYHFSELRMKDGRSGDVPTKLWELLKYFCEYSGRISSETSVDRIFSLRFRNLSKNVSDLNKKLQQVFGINERFCHKYNERDGWVAKCRFNDNTF